MSATSAEAAVVTKYLDKNNAKDALKTGKVEVLTLSPIFFPDAGIENFTKLALEYNKDIRIAHHECPHHRLKLVLAHLTVPDDDTRARA